MNAPNKEYLDLVKSKMPKSQHLKTMFRAFWVGGFICCIGQAFNDIYTKFLGDKMPEDEISTLVTLTLITITVILTGLGIYDKVGAYAGAGSIIPITGFANSVASPAIEHKREGVVLGLCANMFSVAGPVIVFGITSSIIVGIIVLLFRGAFV
ncbi:MAG: stage V sporulation protein AC [Clostridia bacterium]|nr:stage V sporulation protein AC [Clostridia bacterium]